MEKIKAIIVEDKKVQREILEAFCQRSEMVELMGSYSSLLDPALQDFKVPCDLIFLDIGMPKLSGIEFLRANNLKPQVIFITLNKKYAVEAFDYEVTDYIVKPYTYSRFIKGLEKAKKIHLERIGNSINENFSKNEIFINESTRLIKINISDISYIETDGNLINIHLINGELKRAKTSLSNLAKILDGKGFIQCHRRFYICLKRIDEILKNHLRIGTAIIPIGRKYKAKLFENVQLIG